jgi:prophage regulatory protein
MYAHIFPVLPHQRTATSTPSANPAFYRLRDVIRITALSRSTIYRRITEGRFPAPVHLGGRASGWPRTSLQQWIDNPDEYRTSAHSN